MPEDRTPYWYVSEGGRMFGPYSHAMLNERLRDGRVTAKALVWREDWPDWQPIAVHFSQEQTQTEVVGRSAELTDLKGAQIDIARGVILPLVSLATLGFYFFGEPGDDLVDPTIFLWSRIALVGLTAGVTVISVLYWWKRASAKPWNYAGIVKVGIVTWCVLVSVCCIVSLLTLPLQYRIHIARKSFDHYNVQTDVLDGTITVQGLIGPGLANEINTQLGANASIKTVIIDSYGGLVDEALATAQAIQAHGSLTVRARGACNSACLIVFMSGDKRIAPSNMDFGFHAISAITPIVGAYNLESLSQLNSDADSYLLARGIPESMLDAARAAGPRKLVPVSAIELADIGAVTQLIQGGEFISTARAKWLAIIDALRTVPGGRRL